MALDNPTALNKRSSMAYDTLATSPNSVAPIGAGRKSPPRQTMPLNETKAQDKHSPRNTSPVYRSPQEIPETTPHQHYAEHVNGTNGTHNGELDSQKAACTLWMGDLESWMDEAYVRKCISALGWDRDDQGMPTVAVTIKMLRGSSTSACYCFLTFPTATHAQIVFNKFTQQPPMMMPGSERTFKLNWATGLPGLQPNWEGEYSVFVGDLGRDVNEGEVVALFTPLFPSTKSAKIMYDTTTGLSRGYGFVRFGEESDMMRALSLGQNTSGSGLSLRGRTLRISEASGTAAPTQKHPLDAGNPQMRESTGFANGRNMASPLHISVGPNGYHTHTPSPPIMLPYAPSPSAYFPGAAISPAMHAAPVILSPSAGAFPVAYGAPMAPNDPNNTTVFVGGLPACIGEDTLKSFFQHFGEITYVKIPPNKGCGFVQFVRRSDAELAIAKMHDFPIHGKSRIRLSWGRSQGDKQVEHVRKLANALNVPFESVWRMLQGQDNMTIKQIAAAIGNANATRRVDAYGRDEINRQDMAASLAAGEVNLREAEKAAGFEALAARSGGSTLAGAIADSALAKSAVPPNQAEINAHLMGASHSAQGPAHQTVSSPMQQSYSAGTYTRPSPTGFAPFASTTAQNLPLSPPSASANLYSNIFAQSQSGGQAVSPTSPTYDRNGEINSGVNGHPRDPAGRLSPSSTSSGTSFRQNAHSPNNYSTLEESFGQMGLDRSVRPQNGAYVPRSVRESDFSLLDRSTRGHEKLSSSHEAPATFNPRNIAWGSFFTDGLENEIAS